MDNENNYISPSCKVIEVKTQTVLCQSGGTEQFENGGDLTDYFVK